jgi:methylated-DNA-[protein]-cysteine S-methyltransferase
MPELITTFVSSFKTLLGDFWIQVDESKALVGAVIGTKELLLKRSKCSSAILDPKKTRHVQDQVLSYLNHEIKRFSLSVNPQGTAFQKAVWKHLLQLKYAETTSYGAIADKLKSGPRAVGGAIGRNPIALVIPCHRVIGADGSLTGFAFGDTAKRFLLQLEGFSF